MTEHLLDVSVHLLLNSCLAVETQKNRSRFLGFKHTKKTFLIALIVLLFLNTVSVKNTNSHPYTIITLSFLKYSVKNIGTFDHATIALEQTVTCE